MTRWIQNPSRRKCTCQKDVAAVARAEESQPRFLGFRESCYSLRQRTILCRFVCPFVLHSGRKQPPVIRDQIVFRFGPRPDFLAKKTVVLNNPAIIRDDIRHSVSCLYFPLQSPECNALDCLFCYRGRLTTSPHRSRIAFYSHRKRCETYVSLC